MAKGGILRWQKMLIGIAIVIGLATIAFIIVSYFYFGPVSSESTITPYPAKADLDNITIPPSLEVVQTLSPDDIDETFSNIDDLAWLEPVARERRVFLFGEAHYHRYIDQIRNRILFALNTYDRYSLILVERQYSYTPFWDYYVSLADDDEAREFYLGTMYNMVSTREMFELLEHIRRWNTGHPESFIHIGGYDIEHMPKITISEILLPYIQSMDPSFDLSLEMVENPEDIATLLGQLEPKLAEAARKNHTGEYPFLTPKYIANVVENIRSFVLAYRNRQRDFNVNRQQAMIRNLIDAAFFGSYFESGKVMICAGAAHLGSRVPPTPGQNWYWEGSYLSHVYEPTKGKTFSLSAEGCAYQFGEAVTIDWYTVLPTGSNYRRVVQAFQEAYQRDEVDPDGYYTVLRELDLFDSTMLRMAWGHDHLPMLIDGLPRTLLESRKRGRFDNVFGYDAYIYVPRSPIMRVISKQ